MFFISYNKTKNLLYLRNEFTLGRVFHPPKLGWILPTFHVVMFHHHLVHCNKLPRTRREIAKTNVARLPSFGKEKMYVASLVTEDSPFFQPSREQMALVKTKASSCGPHTPGVVRGCCICRWKVVKVPMKLFRRVCLSASFNVIRSL